MSILLFDFLQGQCLGVVQRLGNSTHGSLGILLSEG